MKESLRSQCENGRPSGREVKLKLIRVDSLGMTERRLLRSQTPAPAQQSTKWFARPPGWNAEIKTNACAGLADPGGIDWKHHWRGRGDARR